MAADAPTAERRMIMQCNQICRWNDPSDGCIKPAYAICRMSNIASKKQTNADSIRAMSDEELAHFMADRSVNESTVQLLDKDNDLTAVQIEALRHRIYCALMQWLKQPAE